MTRSLSSLVWCTIGGSAWLALGCSGATTMATDAGTESGDSSIEAGPISFVDASAADATTPFVCDVEPSKDPEKVAGNPSWKMAELAVYEAPVGTTFATMAQSTDAVFRPNYAFDVSKSLTKGLVAHAGPFDSLVEPGIVRAGFTSGGCLRLSRLTLPRGFIISMNLVPSAAAPLGKSFERTAVGPVISVPTLDIDADLFIDGVLKDPTFDSIFPGASQVYGNPSIDGYANIILNFGENAALVSLTAGNYSFKVSISDRAGNTTEDWIRFRVVY